MPTFTINPRLHVEAHTYETSTTWGHTATLRDKSGTKIAQARIRYLNRTWERYTYESVLQTLADKAKGLITPADHATFVAAIANDWPKAYTERVNAQFGTLAAVMAMGDLLTDGQAESNDWKARMLKAGLGGSGLSMPDDWNSLSEADKSARLNAVQQHLSS